MQKYQHFNFLIKIIPNLIKLYLLVLLFMSIPRLYLYLSNTTLNVEYSDIVNAFILGVRLDASILAYIFAPVVLLLFIIWLLNLRFFQKFIYKFLRVYFIVFLTLLFVITFSDLAYFSFFGEHSTLMIFGVFDDDTKALIRTAFDNYNIPLISLISVLFLSFVYFMVFKILKDDKKESLFRWGYAKQFGAFIFIIGATALLGRGSIGLFPISHNVEDVSANQFVNKLPQSSAFAIIDSYTQYKKSKSGNYDLVKSSGYKGRIKEAFAIHSPNKIIDKNDLLKSISFKTKPNKILEQNKPSVVVFMVESFGSPILDYQSKTFDIMGRLRKHFDEDILFTNFISASNGTIVSLEPVLLNITARPGSTSFGQSKYVNTSFSQASARVYQKAGYETSFVYGGDLSWRNVGNFISKQGFDNVEGRAKIANTLGKDAQSISHDWGVFDEYLHSYIYKKLQNAKKPQFIFILTTNNHPPYKIPKDYVSKPLEFSPKLKAHITGSIDLANKRFHDYAYALDSLGGFLDELKSSPLGKNTVVAITADNNTVEGIMKYDNYYTQTKKIPFYIYLPSQIKPKIKIDTTVVGSHKDIFPTLYNLTLSDVRYTAIGTNLLDKDEVHCGFNDAGVLMAKDGGFKNKKAISDEQKKCQNYYNASLAVTEYLIKSQIK